MIHRSDVIDVYEGYVLTCEEIPDDEGFTKYSYQATCPEGHDVFTVALNAFTYQPSKLRVINNFRDWIYFA